MSLKKHGDLHIARSLAVTSMPEAYTAKCQAGRTGDVEEKLPVLLSTSLVLNHEVPTTSPSKATQELVAKPTRVRLHSA